MCFLALLRDSKSLLPNRLQDHMSNKQVRQPPPTIPSMVDNQEDILEQKNEIAMASPKMNATTLTRS